MRAAVISNGDNSNKTNSQLHSANHSAGRLNQAPPSSRQTSGGTMRRALKLAGVDGSPGWKGASGKRWQPDLPSDLRHHFLNPLTHTASPAKGSQRPFQCLLKQPQRHPGVSRVEERVMAGRVLVSLEGAMAWTNFLPIWSAHPGRRPGSHLCNPTYSLQVHFTQNTVFPPEQC